MVAPPEHREEHPYKERDVEHEVQPNEDVPLIALEYGIADWQAVWDHEKNAELREKRGDPHILYKGDMLWIPDVEPKEFEVATNQVHTFTLHRPKTLVHFVLRVTVLDPINLLLLLVAVAIWTGRVSF